MQKGSDHATPGTNDGNSEKNHADEEGSSSHSITSTCSERVMSSDLSKSTKSVPNVQRFEKPDTDMDLTRLCLRPAHRRCPTPGQTTAESDAAWKMKCVKNSPHLSVEHITEMDYDNCDPPCHFCDENKSKPIHGASRLQIVSGGLVPPDGSACGQKYMNLPSPNIQRDKVRSKLFGSDEPPPDREATNDLPPTHSHHPAPSSLERRRALVPPKVICEDVDNDDDAISISSSNASLANNIRRSSVAVIPQMQVCPGDLLVYGKTLEHCNVLADRAEASSKHISESKKTDAQKKTKTTWTFLKLFDRTNWNKSAQMEGLELILPTLQRFEFEDKHLSRYKGIDWSEYLSYRRLGEIPPLYSERQKNTPRSSLKFGTPVAETDSKRSSLLSWKTSSKENKVEEPVVAVTTTPRPARTRAPLLKRTMSEMSMTGRFMRHVTSSANQNAASSTAKPIGEEETGGSTNEVLNVCTSNRTGGRSSIDDVRKTIGQTGADSRRSSCSSVVRYHKSIWDYFQSEVTFLYDHLIVLKNVFMEPLKQLQVEGHLMRTEPDLLFGNLGQLCGVTHAFCKIFISTLVSSDIEQDNMIDILHKLFIEGEKSTNVRLAYHRYTLNYINALNYLETLRKHSDFCVFEKWCNQDERCNKLQLTDLLVAPVQHSMKLPLMLRDILAKTDTVEDRTAVMEMISTEEASLRELDDKMRWLKNYERLLEIQRNIHWPSVFELDQRVFVPETMRAALSRQPCEKLVVSPRRQIVLEDQLHLVESPGRLVSAHVILFDDMLLITKKKKTTQKKKSESWVSRGGQQESTYVVFRHPFSLDRFFLQHIPEQDLSLSKADCSFVLVYFNRFQQITSVITFVTASSQSKKLWMETMQGTQQKWRTTLKNKVFRNVENESDDDCRSVLSGEDSSRSS